MAVSVVPQMNSEVFHSDLCEVGSFYPLSSSNTTVKLEKDQMEPYNCVPEIGATYTDLSTSVAQNKHLKLLKTENDMSSWTHRHPENWSREEVLDWVFYVAELPQYEFDNKTFKGEVFQNLSGAQLCRMNREHFSHLDFEYGEIFYEVLRSMLSGADFTEYGPMLADTNWDDLADNMDMSDVSIVNRLFNWEPQSTNTGLGNSLLDEPMELSECKSGKMTDSNMDDFSLRVDGESSLRVSVDDGATWYDIDPENSRFDLDTVYTVYPLNRPDSEPDQGYSSGASEYGCESPDRPRTDSMSSDSSVHSRLTQSPMHNEQSTWKSSRRRKHSSDSSTEEKNRSRRNPKSTKGSHLWEFIRDLLKDPTTSPSLLRWEDAENGVFRFMQSEQVARKWGEKKNNKNMTYEKLSRAMRFCRTAGYFAEVPKNGKFPKKLCFKFGPKSFGWETEKHTKGTTTHKVS